jgi:NMD protein affecting ribosome stability and mRNA decay
MPSQSDAALLRRARRICCPACEQESQQEYRGRVLLRGPYLGTHASEIRARIANVVARASARQPERRLISTEGRGYTIEVLTTSKKLAHRIARELRKAFGGTTTYTWADDGLLTATWERA